MNTDTPPAIVQYADAPTTGKASYYGAKHAGKLMANGKPFDPKALTCAAWAWPLGTRLKITSEETGMSVIVLCSDRGPNKRFKKRIVDLSEGAFECIAPKCWGLTDVVVEVLP